MKNSILFSDIDREDGWVSSALCFQLENIDSLSYEDCYEELKPKLESDEIVQFVIEDNCLDCDLFGDDETFKFKSTYWDYALVYEFENSDEEVVEFRFPQTDTILSF